MHEDQGELVEVLKFELEVLVEVGFGRWASARWSALSILEDSLTWMNDGAHENRARCSE
jgi:hypothetical protein